MIWLELCTSYSSSCHHCLHVISCSKTGQLVNRGFLEKWPLKWRESWMALWKNQTSRYISFFFFSAHHSMVFYFRCSVYWWKGSVRFWCFKILLVKYLIFRLIYWTKSTYSNWLQPALQNLLFGSSTRDRRAWCIYRRTFSVDENCSQSQWFGRKPAIIARCSVLSPEIVMHDDAYIGGRSENNIKCVVHDHLRWKNQTTRYILSRHWLYEWFSQFRSCGIFLVLSRSHSVVITLYELIESP